MPTNTYTPIGSVTLATATSEVTFTVPTGYRDLIVVQKVKLTAGDGGSLYRFNSDSGSNYYRIGMRGDGSTTESYSFPVATSFRPEWYADIDTNFNSLQIVQIMDASATDKHKTILSRSNNIASTNGVNAIAGRWASTSAITSISITASVNSYAIGSTFNLYGIVA